MGVDVTGVALDADVEGFKFPAETMGQIGKPWGIGKCLAKSKLPFEDAFGSGKSSSCQKGRGHPSLRCLAEMEALDHRPTLTARKFHQPARIGTGDSQRVNHLSLV